MEVSPRIRQMVEIAERSVAARHANLSRLLEAQDSLAEAFAKRFKSAPKHDVEMRLLANLTFQVLVESSASWAKGENQCISEAAKQALSYYAHILCDKPASVLTGTSAPRSKYAPGAVVRHKSAPAKR